MKVGARVSRLTPAQVRDYVDMMRAGKVTHMKLDGLELVVEPERPERKPMTTEEIERLERRRREEEEALQFAHVEGYRGS